MKTNRKLFNVRLMRNAIFIILAGLNGFPFSVCSARELRVDRQAAGAYATIQQAVNAAQPGDVIRLAPQDSPYYETVVFHNKSGTAQNPIILDGQGATLDGSEALRADEWQQISSGLYRSIALPVRLKISDSVLGRYYFIINDKLQRMGGASKGKGRTKKQPDKLEVNEWSYEPEEKVFYLRLAPEQQLDTVRIPVRAEGVALNGNCEYLTIRNLTATRVWNDGFNIHQRSREIRFENIRAIECGDDGISAHEDCRISVDGFLSRGNATGFCHVGQSQSDSRNVLIEDCVSYGVYLLDDSRHTLENCTVRSSGEYLSGYAVRLTKNTQVEMKNLLLIGTGPRTAFVVEAGAVLDAQQLSLWNTPLTISAATTRLFHSIIAGPQSALTVSANAVWEANQNRWDIKSIRWHDQLFAAAEYSAYARASGQDADSRWETITEEQLPPQQYKPETP